MKITLTFVLVSLVICCFITFPLLGQMREPVVLLFAGDLTLAHRLESAVGDNTEYVFEHWNELQPFDLFMVNLENPITTSSTKVEKEFNFKMHPKYLRTLRSGGVTIVNMANNHVADYGLEGIYDTMRYLDSVGVQYVGIGKNLNDARTPRIVEVKGKKIGFLGYHGGGSFAATKQRAGIAPRFLQYIVEDVQKLRLLVDFLVVNFHWGTELAEYPDESQIALAHKVVDAGADLIVGHHPHVLQGIERYRGATIAYSLGNFVFGGNGRHTYNTALLRVVLTEKNPAIELVPLSVVQWQPRLASPGVAKNILSIVQRRSSIFDQSFLTNVGVAR